VTVRVAGRDVEAVEDAALVDEIAGNVPGKPLQQARDAFARALEYDPEFHKARYNLGLVHMRLGSELLREARDAMPEDTSSRATDVYLSCLLARTVRNPELEIPCPDLP
jgi:hypothetical protein